MVIKEEIGRFCQSTSVKGIPRAAKADHKGMRVTWILSVCVMITVAIYQVHMLVTEYLSYPSYTVSQEKVFHLIGDFPVLPTLTLCNENPFSSLKPPVSIYGLPTLDDYYSQIDALTSCTGCDSATASNMATMSHIMRNRNAYFQTLGNEYSKLIGHDLENFIIGCKEKVLIGMTYYDRNCTDLIKITLSQNADYFNCYRVELPNDYDVSANGMIAGVELIVYLDNTDRKYNINDSNSDILPSGVIATPTHQEGNPFSYLDGIHLAAGTALSIELIMEKQFRLEPPWGVCHPSQVEGYEGLKMCYSDCFQNDIQRNCGCTDTRLVMHVENETHPYCLKANLTNPLQMAANFACANRYFTIDNADKCIVNCPLPCREFGYKMQSSFTKWPSPSSMVPFYEKYIRSRDYERHFETVNAVITGNCSGEADCMLKYLTAEKLVEENFLKVEFLLSDIRYVNTEEKKKIGVADFCSRLGGTLNLWAGITVVVVLELIEVLCRIISGELQAITSGSSKSDQKETKEGIKKSKATETSDIHEIHPTQYSTEDNYQFGSENVNQPSPFFRRVNPKF